MSERATPSQAVRRWALILYWISMYVATHWPDIDDYKPEGGWPVPYFSQIVHVMIYAGWIAMWWWVLIAFRGHVSRAAMSWLIIGGTAFAAFDELTQKLISGRHNSLDDFLLDLLGIFLASLILSGWQQWRSGRNRAGHAHEPSS